jgi:ribosomal protein L35AE/L33A
MSYYGFEHRYGANTTDEAGDLIGKLVIFKTRMARDCWVLRGHCYDTQPGARTKIKSRAAAKFQRISANVEHAK